MDSTQKKYQIGTPENRAFLAQNAECLLTFGPPPEAAPIIWATTAHRGKTGAVRHGSRPVCATSTVWASFWAIPAAQSWRTRL